VCRACGRPTLRVCPSSATASKEVHKNGCRGEWRTGEGPQLLYCVDARLLSQKAKVKAGAWLPWVSGPPLQTLIQGQPGGTAPGARSCGDIIHCHPNNCRAQGSGHKFEKEPLCSLVVRIRGSVCQDKVPRFRLSTGTGEDEDTHPSCMCSCRALPAPVPQAPSASCWHSEQRDEIVSTSPRVYRNSKTCRES
jgi:hypothetical protein